MTKRKCMACGEKHDEMHLIMECSNCYINGIINESRKVFKREMDLRFNNLQGSKPTSEVSPAGTLPVDKINKLKSWLVEIKEFNAHDSAWIEKTIERLDDLIKEGKIK